MLNRGVTPDLPPGVARLVADRSEPASMQSALAASDWDAVFDVSGVVKVAGGTDADEIADLLADRIGRYVYVSSQSLYHLTGEFPWTETSPTVTPDVGTTHPAAVGEVFNVTISAVTSAGYTAALADVVRVPAEVIPLPKEFAENSRGPLFSRLFAPAHHGMLDATKITQALGVTPGLDLRAGHANTLEWYLRSGAAAVDDALSDPLWNRGFDFGYEAEVAARVRNRLLRKDA